MKKHFNSLFDAAHRWWTISFLFTSVALIITSLIIGTTDNPLGIALFLSGIIFLFLSLIHIWKKSENYIIMASIFSIILILTWVFRSSPFMNEALVMGIIGVFCIPGIIIGVFGAIFRAIKK